VLRRPYAYRYYIALSVLFALLQTMHFTIAAIYYVTVVNLNPFQLVLAGTTLMSTILLCEVPTGIVADMYSRRLSVVIGVGLIGLGYLLEAAIPSFIAILAAQVIWGLGATFMSGALEAWIADELNGLSIDMAYIRAAQGSYAGSLLGIGFSVFLATIKTNLPMLISGTSLIVLAIVLMLTMPEHNFTPKPRADRNSWQSMQFVFKNGLGIVQKDSLLITIFGIIFFSAIASETFDRLWEVHFLKNFTFPTLGNFQPVIWFGVINAGALLLSIFGSELIRQQVGNNKYFSVPRALLIMTTVVIVSMVGFGLAKNFSVALIAYWSACVIRRVIAPIMTAWLNQRVESELRATVISMSGQVDAIGQIGGGPLFGLLATVTSTRTAMVVAGLVLIPALLLYKQALHLPATQQVSVSPTEE